MATSRLVTGSTYHTVTQYLDGLGRVTKTVDGQACNGAGSTVITSYDSLGRVASVTNPYCNTSDSAYGSTLYGYDALSRTTSVQAPDGSPTSVSFAGSSSSSTYCSTVKDPANKVREL